MKIDAVRALMRAHMDGDHERFKSMALVIAANEEGKSPQFAKSVRDLVGRDPSPQLLVALPTDLAGMLATDHPTHTLADMVLENATRERLRRVIVEQEWRERLADHNLFPMRKVLLVGPPGVGKTMAAGAIASELKLPLVRVQLHEVVGQYMGTTAANLAKVFAGIRTFRAVYLFDEFDGLAANRASLEGSPGAEMRRVMSSLLQFIELDRSESIIVAATNFVEVIDKALFRRFDDVIALALPDHGAVKRLVASRLPLPWKTAHDSAHEHWDSIARAGSGMGHADIVAACDRVAKETIMLGLAEIDPSEIARALQVRRDT